MSMQRFTSVSVRAVKGRQPSFVSQRAMHVENRVNNNFPFRYEGESKTRFTVGFVSVATIGFSAPFLACAFQLKKAAAT
ncbi:hypothetical protein BMF94_1197 [Rhodotorula taiwanensis]|uniref:Cytochrome c oxidase subunit 8, mitochondrial n=1 Tax=Rhodotorula taiwanensis TaxID=741276 RepID=A0A2S5BFM9_9BASI|nr:hypothetical protein BMF94_1197 [Rhodotorula taiwanensis]